MKTLKLVGLQTFISPFTKFNVIRKGDTIAVDDSRADHLRKGFESSPAMGNSPHWELCPNGTNVTYNFVSGSDAVAPAPAADPVEPTADELEVAKRVAAAQQEAHDEEVAARLAAQAEADKLNPPPASVEPVAPVAPVAAEVAAKPTKAKQRVARTK